MFSLSYTVSTNFIEKNSADRPIFSARLGTASDTLWWSLRYKRSL